MIKELTFMEAIDEIINEKVVYRVVPAGKWWMKLDGDNIIFTLRHDFSTSRKRIDIQDIKSTWYLDEPEQTLLDKIILCSYCGARKRINHPFGKKSKGRSVYITNHSEKCPYKKREEN